jgi:hypothetical protein
MIEFFGDPILNTASNEAGEVESWGMLTHGICNLSVGGWMRFSKFMIGADQMGEPTEENLAERVQKAATKLRYMGEGLAQHYPDNPEVQQFIRASEMLLQERCGLAEAMRVSFQTVTEGFTGAVLYNDDVSR